MRRGTIIFLVINLIVIGFLLNAFSTLISLLFEDGAADAIHRSDIPAPGSDLIENRTQLIPKIIHQTYINASIPVQWKDAQQSCIDLHDDYEYVVRTSADKGLNIVLMNNCSFGPMKSRENSLQQNTLGSLTPSTNIHSPYNVPILFDTLFLRFMEAFISTSTTAAIDA